jgi:hypothetical protein
MGIGTNKGGRKGQVSNIALPLHFWKKSKCKKKEI